MTRHPRHAVTVAAVISALVLIHSSGASADEYRERHRDRDYRTENSGGDTTGYASVTHVTAIHEQVETRVPHRECYQEDVQRDGNNGNGGAVVGAVAGGLLGHAAGHNSESRKLDTVAGAIVGAVAGKELSKSDPTTTTEERCETREENRVEERTVGYDVTYRYFGHDYHTRMDHDPGDRIRVNVSVRPAE